MSIAEFSSIRSAVVKAYPSEMFGQHKVICQLNTNTNKYSLFEKGAIPPGYTRLTLSEINSLVQKQISDTSFTGSMHFADAMEYMGHQKMRQSFSCFPGSIKWFFVCLANWLSGNGFQTTADHAKDLSTQIIDIAKAKNPYDYRARIFQETVKAYKYGYSKGESIIAIDNEAMLKGTEKFGADTVGGMPPLPPLDPSKKHKTKFLVSKEDTFNVMLRYAKAGEKPVGINMANQHHPGGGVISGCPAQEEALCRRSNHYLGLEGQTYPLPDFGGIYCPNVTVFREDETRGYAFMDKPEKVNLVAIAAYDLRGKETDPEKLKNDADYMNGTREKIRNTLRIMAIKEHGVLVPGALGCGAFQNPPTLVASLFQEVFKEPEFDGRFKIVDFAILCQYQKDEANVAAFQTICEHLSQ